jgi:lipocalin-like protein
MEDQMTTRTIGQRLWDVFAALTMLALLLVPLTGDAVAQQKTLKEQLVGTWLMATNITISPDGSRADTYGPNAQGIAIFDSSGRFTLVTTRADLPNFASNNRGTGTADENRAVVRGSLAYFGRYSVNETDKSYTVQIEASIFPNWVGTAQTRTISMSGDEFTLTNPAGSGGGSVESKYKRAK